MRHSVDERYISNAWFSFVYISLDTKLRQKCYSQMAITVICKNGNVYAVAHCARPSSGVAQSKLIVIGALTDPGGPRLLVMTHDVIDELRTKS